MDATLPASLQLSKITCGDFVAVVQPRILQVNAIRE
jgi:hypothetical protein